MCGMGKKYGFGKKIPILDYEYWDIISYILWRFQTGQVDFLTKVTKPSRLVLLPLLGFTYTDSGISRKEIAATKSFLFGKRKDLPVFIYSIIEEHAKS